jgi:hypothetical protein
VPVLNSKLPTLGARESVRHFRSDAVSEGQLTGKTKGAKILRAFLPKLMVACSTAAAPSVLDVLSLDLAWSE